MDDTEWKKHLFETYLKTKKFWVDERLKSWKQKARSLLSKIIEQNSDKIQDLSYNVSHSASNIAWSPGQTISIIKITPCGKYCLEHHIDTEGVKRLDYTETFRTPEELSFSIMLEIKNNQERNYFINELQKRTGINLKNSSQ